MWETVVATSSHIWAAKQDRIIGVGLDMFLQVLRTLEGLPAKLATMRFERNVDTDVGRNMVPLDNRNVAVGPSTLQVEVVCALTADVVLADMFLQ